MGARLMPEQGEKVEEGTSEKENGRKSESKGDDSIDKDEMEKQWAKEREEGTRAAEDRKRGAIQRQPEHRYPSK